MADDFTQFLLGDTKPSPNPNNFGNIRPVGSTTGFQQYDTPEAGIKAVDDQLRIYGSKHKVKTLREVISRYAPPSENDTEAYIKNVSQRTGLNPDEEIDLSNPAIRHIISGPIILQEQGLTKIKGSKQTQTEQPATEQTAQSTDEFVDFLNKPAIKEPLQTKQNLPSREDVIKAVAPQQQKTTVGASTAALADVLPNIGGAVADLGAYTAARYGLKKSPQEARQIADVYSEGFKNPVGKATGLVGTEEYTNAPANKLMDFIGRNIDKGAHWIAKNTGMAHEDVQNIINAGSFIIPEVGGRVVKRFKGAEIKGTEKTTVPPGGTGETGQGITTVSPITETAPIGPKYDVPTYLRNKFQEKQGGAPVVEAPAATTTTLGTAKLYDPARNFSEVNYAETALPVEEHLSRAEVLNRIDPNLKVDPNIIEGRGKERATDYQLSKTDTPEGNLLSEKEKEYKISLNKYGEKLITDTGGTIGLDETANYRRGQGILDYPQKLENHFNKKLTEIYSERDKIAKDIPVNGESINKSLNDESLTTLNSESEGLAKAAKAKLKSLHMMDEKGNMLPSNGMQAEKFRQWLNENNVWDRKNAQLHRSLKDAVDADVISTLDPNTSIYKDARDLFILKKDTLENPNGISKILDAEGPNKINRKVDIENIPNAITRMGVDQFTHILDTIKNAPPELQQAANNSLLQIKAHFLNQAHEAFQASANKGTAYLKTNREVMTRLFSPEEMSKINDYNSGAHILKADTGYPGARVQEINIDKRLPRRIGEQILKKGAAIGAEAITSGSTFGIAGTTAHEIIGGKIAKGEAKSLEKIYKQNANKKQAGFTNLQDIMNAGKKE